MIRTSKIKVKIIRLSAILVAAAVTMSVSSCQFLDRLKPAQKHEALIMLPSNYIPPIQADWSSIFLAPQLPAKYISEKAFNEAWNQQLRYIRNKMADINEHGHYLYADLLKMIDPLIKTHKDTVSSLVTSIEEFTLILLQTDTLSKIVQSKQLTSSSEQAVMEYNWLLASAKLANQSTEIINVLLTWVLDNNNNLNENESLKFESDFVNILEIQRPLLKSSRDMVEAQTRLQLADFVIGSLLDGAILAQREAIQEHSDSLLSKGRLDGQTSEEIRQQLSYLQSSNSAENDSQSYITRAKGFAQLYAVYNEYEEAAFNFLFSPFVRVHTSVNEELRELCEAVDDGSGNRLSAAASFVRGEVINMSDALGLTEEQSTEALQAAVLAGSELSISENSFEQIQLISDATFAELEYLDREDENLTNALAAYGYQMLAELTGYIETSADNSLSWLTGTWDAVADMLVLPPEEETAHLQEEISQLSVLLFGEARSEPETQYLSDLLGIDFLNLEQELNRTGQAWLQELTALAEQFADFLGPEAVNTISSLNHLIDIPYDLFAYPLNRLSDAGTEMSRYSQVQGNRMTLSVLESIQSLYIALEIRDNVKLDGLTEELDQAINGYVDFGEVLNNAAQLIDEKLEQALLALLNQLDYLNNRRINQLLIERLQRLIELYGAAGDTPTANTTSEQEETAWPSGPPPSELSQDIATPPSDSQADVWEGRWAGSIRIHRLDMPENYSAEEIEALLKTEIAIEFTVMYTSGGHEINIANLQGNPPQLKIDHQQMIISFRESAPDGASIYQIMVGELSDDTTQIAGDFSVGIENIGDSYSGSWFVVRQS